MYLPGRYLGTYFYTTSYCWLLLKFFLGHTVVIQLLQPDHVVSFKIRTTFLSFTLIQQSKDRKGKYLGTCLREATTLPPSLPLSVFSSLSSSLTSSISSSLSIALLLSLFLPYQLISFAYITSLFTLIYSYLHHAEYKQPASYLTPISLKNRIFNIHQNFKL
ncbi:hypothetical protein F4860DRAFT_410438 [Xylaria cubensis]|nr:hypothetical protein F4860DRAFT_410438 [Xylaria cubensis]